MHVASGKKCVRVCVFACACMHACILTLLSQRDKKQRPWAARRFDRDGQSCTQGMSKEQRKRKVDRYLDRTAYEKERQVRIRKGKKGKGEDCEGVRVVC